MLPARTINTFPITPGTTLTVDPATNTIRSSSEVKTLYHGGTETEAMYLTTQGQNRLSINAAGNVGVNKAPNAAYRVDVDGSLNVDGGVFLNGIPFADYLYASNIYFNQVGVANNYTYIDVEDVKSYRQVQKIGDVSPLENSYLSYNALSVTADGSWMVVGAPMRSGGRGGVLLYQRNVAAAAGAQEPWMNVPLPDSAGVNAGDEMGYSVALSGEGLVLLVSERGTGKVYAWKRASVNDGWGTRTTLLTGPAGGFGGHVSISSYQAIEDGYYVAVTNAATSTLSLYFLDGAAMFTGNGVVGGQVWPMTTFTPSYSVVPPIASYGASLAMTPEGVYVAVGHPTDFSNNGAAEAGAVYVYYRVGAGKTATWVALEKVSHPDLTAGCRFGTTVSMATGLNSTWIMVGAPKLDSASGIETGVVMVYTVFDTEWTYLTRITAPDTVSGDGFGTSVALDNTGEYMVVGALAEVNVGGVAAGSVYGFRWLEENWVYEGKMKPVDGTTNCGFGQMVAVTSGGGFVAVGAYASHTYKAFSGAVYWFHGAQAAVAYDVRSNVLALRADVVVPAVSNMVDMGRSNQRWGTLWSSNVDVLGGFYVNGVLVAGFSNGDGSNNGGTLNAAVIPSNLNLTTVTTSDSMTTSNLTANGTSTFNTIVITGETALSNASASVIRAVTLQGSNVYGSNVGASNIVVVNSLYAPTITAYSLEAQAFIKAPTITVAGEVTAFNVECFNVVGSNVVGSNVVGSNVIGMSVIGTNIIGSNVEGSNVVGSNVVASNMYVGNVVTPGAFTLELEADSAAKPGTNTWTISSDQRLKEDIVEADLDVCYSNVRSIPLKYYKWRDDIYTTEQVRDRHMLGWIAQDVAPVFPQSVAAVDGLHGINNCLTLNTDQLLASLYGCVQRLQEMMEEKDREIAELKSRLP